jgi:hypothetical protein
MFLVALPRIRLEAGILEGKDGLDGIKLDMK